MLLVINRAITRLRRIDYYIVHIEGDVSGDVRKEVEKQVREFWLKLQIDGIGFSIKGLSFKELCASTRHLFRWIKNIEVRRIPYRSGAYISIVSHGLLYIVNEKYVVTDAGDLLPKNIFKSPVLNKLGHIQILFEDAHATELSDADKLSDECKQFIFLSPTDTSILLSDYVCIWENENSVWFFDKGDMQYALLMHPNQLPTEKKLRSIFFLKEELIKREKDKQEKLSKKGVRGRVRFGQASLDNLEQQKTWVIDVRFKDQIVVSQRGPHDKWGKKGVPTISGVKKGSPR